MADDYVVNDPELIAELEDVLDAVEAETLSEAPKGMGDTPSGMEGRTRLWEEGHRRREQMIMHLRDGMTPSQACEEIGISKHTYDGWRKRWSEFAARCDEAKLAATRNDADQWDGTPASFHATFFGHKPTWFQLLFLRELEMTPPGNILLVLWPPEFGKTTTFENHASMKLALDPGHRFLVASESRGIAQKILGRVMDRMDPNGPTPEYCTRFGPFVPERGSGRARSSWSDVRFRVSRARHSDERDYSMLAVGGGSKNIVSTRTDHAHVDDIQSTTTIGQTSKLVTWFRQDLLSRPGETGITTVCGTRVDEGDFYEALLDDPDLDSSIMKVLRFPAVMTDHATNEQKSLWPEKWPLDKLERQKKKVGQEAWDRNYMQNPGLSTRGRGTFGKDTVEPCKDSDISLMHQPPEHSIVYVGVDPALGGKNCVMAVEATPDYKLIVRRIREDIDLKNNSQVIAALADTVRFVSMKGAHVTDVVIEAMAFQRGLIHDENLLALRDEYGFAIRDHLTGWNKYDPDIGIPSMAESFNKREIVLPWAEDDYTRFEIGELVRQLYAWKPGVRGNALRQDRVMALWFCWIMWRERWKRPAEARSKAAGWRTSGLPYAPTRSGLLLPSAMRSVS